jgi:hypothetical protein
VVPADFGQGIGKLERRPGVERLVPSANGDPAEGEGVIDERPIRMGGPQPGQPYGRVDSLLRLLLDGRGPSWWTRGWGIHLGPFIRAIHSAVIAALLGEATMRPKARRSAPTLIARVDVRPAKAAASGTGDGR